MTDDEILYLQAKHLARVVTNTYIDLIDRRNQFILENVRSCERLSTIDSLLTSVPLVADRQALFPARGLSEDISLAQEPIDFETFVRSCGSGVSRNTPMSF